MPLITHDEILAVSDADAIAELRAAFDRQRRAFLVDPYPTLEERSQRIGALAMMMMGHRDRIRRAVSEDFGAHPELSSDLFECLGIASRAQYALAQLPQWMADEERYVDPALGGTGKAFVQYQPKGVVGNIAPWNFPFEIGLGPVVEMLAAGNRVIIKPSDYAPACGELLAEMVRNTFDREHVTVVTGGLELARAFPTLPWDHLLYTGSPGIGREVMKAAAENLTPVTLELGGKCPVILLDDAVDMNAAKGIIGTKMIKNGQMCISVDYLLVPRTRLREFVDLAIRYVRENVPDYSRGDNCTGIIANRHLERLRELRQQAVDAGYEVVEIEEGGAIDAVTRRMPLSLVVDPGDELGLMMEEIFGPILPVKPYDHLDDAIAYVNAGERPLGLYVFGKDEAVIQRVLTQTTSGGAGVNACAVQGAIPALGFGGIGMSGMGRHHGIDGFREFSNPRGVFVRGENDLIEAFCPPYGDAAKGIVEGAFTQAPGSA